MTFTDKITDMKKEFPKALFSQNAEELTRFTVKNPLIEGSIAPGCVIRPASVEELQAIVRSANKNNINITVSSSKGDHRKGGIASQKDHIHIDLSGWDEVFWINRRNRVCHIGPGVTYKKLIEALEPHGMTVSMPIAPRSGKSVAAAVIDREPSSWSNKQWDICDPVGSTEFIFGNGEIFRTGAAGGPGSLEKQRAIGGAQKCPLGPSQTDFHRVIQGAQGTMGIVTWMTMRTEVIPQVKNTFLLGDDDLTRLIPFVYEVQRPGLGEHSFIMDKLSVATLICGSGKGDFSSVYRSLPEYVCLQNIGGFDMLPEKRVAYQTKDIEEIAGRNGLKMVSKLGCLDADTLLKAATTPCGEEDFRKAGSKKGECLSVFFLTTLNKVPEFSKIYRYLADQFGFTRESTGIYIQPVVQNHACHVEFMTHWDPADEKQAEKIKRLEKEATLALSQKGAFFSRPYGTAEEIVFNRNPGSYDLLKKVKDIFDPNRILNNGKWGM